MASTTSTPRPAPGTHEPGSADAESARAHAIIARAGAALDAGDTHAYAQALLETETLTSVHRRHQARLGTIQHGLLARPATPAVVAATMIEALRGLVTWLEDEPREPTLLSYLGVLAVELGAFREAEAVLDAALRLDPELPASAATRADARKRRKAKLTVPGLPAAVKQTLKALRPRMLRIAERAVPDEDRSISLCMIVRDEEEMLPRCLEAVKDGVGEMIIVDTGSIDRTVEIAESFGARVLHHEWTGNFGEARNVGLDAATGDWLLIIDADEILVDDDAVRLRELASKTWREAFYLVEFNHTGDLDDGTAVAHNALRLVRNRPEYRYEGLVHEQIARHLPGFLPDRFEVSKVRMDHFGYLGAVREAKDKSNRNLQLLLDQLAGGEDGAFVHFNLGSEYSIMPGEDARALEHFEAAWERITDDPFCTSYGFFPALAKRYVGALAGAAQYARVDEAAAFTLERLKDFTDIVFEQGRAAMAAGEHERARELFERCLEMGDAPASYMASAGCGTFMAELQLVQLDVHDEALGAATERLRRVRKAHPNYLGAIDPLIQTLFVSGASADDVLAELTADGPDLSPSGWFMLGVNLQERGHLAEAEAAFRGALDRRPTLSTARVALADALLVQGRIEEAAAQAEQVPADGRTGGAAVRTALFALLALEAADELAARREALLAELSVSDLSAADQLVLRAWAQVRAGEQPAPIEQGIEAANAITPMLGALLRLGAADAFADLVKVLALTGLETRTLHEILATLFLSHGLPELAGDEWIAAVEADGPDADAFAGLAEVARMRGMHEDAATMAAEALAMEPDHALATRVLAALAGTAEQAA